MRQHFVKHAHKYKKKRKTCLTPFLTRPCSIFSHSGPVQTRATAEGPELPPSPGSRAGNLPGREVRRKWDAKWRVQRGDGG